ncbi:Crossover junction endodeoxyribonuclease RuvC [Candidatus Johnevansia muelleri]|uniref:Crossover junction endodeoxyribonuclease RuvC n=1 Tax=Candidatus Johnevansia muelleri TaxID=1495769 RepID=A0A078KBQ6_9GAMM|nr:Crossover junction endodeoxyribonuclease RuvC [Candidatus Evansia muelleri]
MIILGIDPGYSRIGFGIIERYLYYPYYIDSGYINISAINLGQKLIKIYTGMSEIINRYCPSEIAIEQVFISKNADSALKLGQTRGCTIVCISNNGLPIFEYTPSFIKKSITGYGIADKLVVKKNIYINLKIEKHPQSDASDAIAIALTHCYKKNNY